MDRRSRFSKHYEREVERARDRASERASTSANKTNKKVLAEKAEGHGKASKGVRAMEAIEGERKLGL